MPPRILVLTLGTLVLLSLLAYWVGTPPSPVINSNYSPNKITPRSESDFPLVGTATCSARGCHGSHDSLHSQEIHRNEFTLWIGQDKHANAYQVLFSPQSQAIAKNLRLKKKPSEESQCLVCHTNPLAANTTGFRNFNKEHRKENARIIKEEMAFGIGCESCHGGAGKWLSEHTQPRWRAYSAEEKRQKFGFHPLTLVENRVHACLGCHVGAADDKKRGIPVRDVDHDLIAAGHPRLNFEFSTYLANMPPHWNRHKQNNPHAKESYPETRTWLIGQLACAQQSLELLANRASTDKQNADQENAGKWPVLAEYDCFACHHDLQHSSRRRQPKRKGSDPLNLGGLTPFFSGFGKRTTGALPWGMWYFTMPRVLALASSKKEIPFVASLNKLSKLMARPIPPREEVAKQARITLEHLRKLQSNWRDQQLNRHSARQLLSAMVIDGKEQVEAGWDAAEQFYQAVISFNQDLQDPSIGKTLKDLESKRAFAPGFDSPSGFLPQAIVDPLRSKLEPLLQR